MAEVRGFLERMLEVQLEQLASLRKSDFLAIYGPMSDGLPAAVRHELENLIDDTEHKSKLTIILNTGGGLISASQKTPVSRDFTQNFEQI